MRQASRWWGCRRRCRRRCGRGWGGSPWSPAGDPAGSTTMSASGMSLRITFFASSTGSPTTSGHDVFRSSSPAAAAPSCLPPELIADLSHLRTRSTDDELYIRNQRRGAAAAVNDGGARRQRQHDLAMLGGGKESHVVEVGSSGGEAAVCFRPGRDHDDETVAL
ncbi:Os12g0548600 [Oryza sativa Japonica Group]|uniref:Os12g0548600 protein n=1 Tax=Oryza sativa subsp. japonica TaxID=39947 RepID=Q0IMS4_ORYSJ|nr:Os12g0548600 [Oryza sativa Japonica Group]|eukprot:NP_001066972.1 Os12g0548600 [Oryza sativa Japonica Group]